MSTSPASPSSAHPPDGEAPEPAWLLHPHAIVRSTGFPFEALATLAAPRTVELVDRAEALDELVAAAIGPIVDAVRLHPQALGPGPARKLRRALTRRSALPRAATGLAAHVPDLARALEHYEQAAARRDATIEELTGTAPAETAAVHARLVELMVGERWREAIFLQSPSMHDRGLQQLADAAARPNNGRARGVRRQFAGYVQRLCAKNETTAFFGPVDYADFEPSVPGLPRTGPPARRHSYVAHWVVAALADRIAADRAVRPWLSPRVGSLVAGVDGPSPTRGGMPIELTAVELALLRACDGHRTVAELTVAVDADPVESALAIDDLARRRMLVVDCHPPVTEPRALEWLADFVASLPAAVAALWLEPLRELAAQQDAFATAGLEDRRTILSSLEARVPDWIGQQARRGSGELYADRLVLHEECLGALTPLHLGPRTRDALHEQLAPVLTLFAGQGVAHHRVLTRAFVERHPQLAAGETMALIDLLRLTEPDIAGAAESTAACRYVEQRLAAAGTEQTLDIAADELPPVDLGEDPLIAAPDVLFLARDADELRSGDCDIVVGECHDTLMLWGWALQFHSDRGAVERAGERLLARASGARSLANVLGSRRAKIVPFVFPGPVIDATGARTPYDAPPPVRIAEVGVRLLDGRLVCCAPKIPAFLLYHGELESPVHNVLAPPRVRPVAFGGDAPHTPRIRIGRAVLQRERWRIARDELVGEVGTDPVASLRQARAAGRRLGLPRRVFVKVPGERKPVLLDLEAPVLLDLVAHLSRDTTELVLTEMLPSPEHLWLTGPEGRHSAEVRMTLALDRRCAEAREP